MKKQPKKTTNVQLPTFSVIGVQGPVFLHWGNASIKIADDGNGVVVFMERMRAIQQELKEEYPELTTQPQRAEAGEIREKLKEADGDSVGR